MTTLEQSRTPPTGAAEIMPFGTWESAPAATAGGAEEVLFRFPAADDPAPSTARLLTMSLYAAALGLVGVGVGVRAIVTVWSGASFWFVPTLVFFGLLSVGLAVGSFLSIHRPVLPWLLLLAATGPLVADLLLAALY